VNYEGIDMSEDKMSEEEQWKLSGAEDRRKEQRRKAVDRRDMIRFEVEKEDRRKGKDRRGSHWGTNQPI
jgi:hypothetical protein